MPAKNYRMNHELKTSLIECFAIKLEKFQLLRLTQLHDEIFCPIHQINLVTNAGASNSWNSLVKKKKNKYFTRPHRQMNAVDFFRKLKPSLRFSLINYAVNAAVETGCKMHSNELKSIDSNLIFGHATSITINCLWKAAVPDVNQLE